MDCQEQTAFLVKCLFKIDISWNHLCECGIRVLAEENVCYSLL